MMGCVFCLVTLNPDEQGACWHCKRLSLPQQKFVQWMCLTYNKFALRGELRGFDPIIQIRYFLDDPDVLNALKR